MRAEDSLEGKACSCSGADSEAAGEGRRTGPCWKRTGRDAVGRAETGWAGPVGSAISTQGARMP